jgi:Ca2+-binding EF-hand superfamily protein
MIELEKEITWWTRAEITNAWKRYEKLYNEFGIEHERLTHEKPLDLFDHNGYAHVEAVSIPIDFILENFEELKVNPFRREICNIFSSDENQASMTFIDFLDMVSGLSPKNPLNTRIVYAFLIFDFDGDGHLGPDDLKTMLDYYTGKDQCLDDQHKDKLIEEVFHELNKSKTSRAGLHLQDFRVAVNRSPDFSKTFSFRI